MTTATTTEAADDHRAPTNDGCTHNHCGDHHDIDHHHDDDHHLEGDESTSTTSTTTSTTTTTLPPTTTPTLPALPLSGSTVLSLFGPSCGNGAQFSGSHVSITGELRSNGNVMLSGSSVAVTGKISYGGSANIGHGTTAGVVYSALPVASGLPWQISDFAPGGVYSKLPRYVAHTDSINISSTSLAPGIHYVAGDVRISNSNPVLAGVTIVATGRISISGSTTMTPAAATAHVALRWRVVLAERHPALGQQRDVDRDDRCTGRRNPDQQLGIRGGRDRRRQRAIPDPTSSSADHARTECFTATWVHVGIHRQDHGVFEASSGSAVASIRSLGTELASAR